jgi:hypothetical protein
VLYTDLVSLYNNMYIKKLQYWSPCIWYNANKWMKWFRQLSFWDWNVSLSYLKCLIMHCWIPWICITHWQNSTWYIHYFWVRLKHKFDIDVGSITYCAILIKKYFGPTQFLVHTEAFDNHYYFCTSCWRCLKIM